VEKSAVIALVFLAALASIAIGQEIEMKPEETEAWDFVPPKVTPGTNDRAPSDAIILDPLAWQSIDGGENPWDVEDGVMTIKPGTKDIRTKKAFGNIQLHVEWRTPNLGGSSEGQDRGNSGVFLQQFYEVQVLDSHGGITYGNGQAGSIYKQYPPLVNATKPMMEWQTYDIIYTAPQFDKGGNVTSPASMTVLHNGIVVQNNSILKGPSVFIGYPRYQPHGDLPIYLQDHDHKVSYRNIWLREL